MVWILALPLALFSASVAWAHPLAPASLRLTEGAGGVVEVRWRVAARRPAGGTLTPVMPGRCRRMSESGPRPTADGRAIEESFRIDCGEPGLVGSTLAVSGLSRSRINVVVDVTLSDGSTAQILLHSGRPSFVVGPAQGAGQVLAGFIGLGAKHLIAGADHVLLVLGLFALLGLRMRLLQAVTAFTLGHSLSLGLAVLGYVSFPQAVTEIAIAASLVVLAVDILRSQSSRGPGPVARWPWAVCSGFGLLHGLGFAGALSEAGLPQHAVPLALLSFNLGIELGQVALVLAAACLSAAVRRWTKPNRAWANLAPAYAIGSLAAFWVMERSLAAVGLAIP